MDQLSLMCNREADFPSMSLEIYATPDAQIKVTGTNTLIYTWKVDSPVKEQQDITDLLKTPVTCGMIPTSGYQREKSGL